jgi:hypothetical protein
LHHVVAAFRHHQQRKTLLTGETAEIRGIYMVDPFGGVILACLTVATTGATLGHLATLRPITETTSRPASHTYQDLIAREHGAAKAPPKAGTRDI